MEKKIHIELTAGQRLHLLELLYAEREALHEDLEKSHLDLTNEITRTALSSCNEIIWAVQGVEANGVLA